jgi:hypothetical protein
MIKKTLLTLMMAGASLIIAQKASAQYYGSFDVNINPGYDPHSSVGDAMMFDSIMNNARYIQQQNVVIFKQQWLYQWSRLEKTVKIRFAPGLGAAIKNNDWAAAYSFFETAWEREVAYEKYYHRPSPAYIAVAHSVGLQVVWQRPGKTALRY